MCFCVCVWGGVVGGCVVRGMARGRADPGGCGRAEYGAAQLHHQALDHQRRPPKEAHESGILRQVGGTVTCQVRL